MGGQSSQIDTSSVKIEHIKASTPIQQSRFCPPFRKFSNQKINIDGKRMEALLEIQEPSREKIRIQQEFFRDLEDAFDSRTKQILIQSVLTDEHYFDLRTFNGSINGVDKTFQLKPFANHNSFHFNNILYEIHMNEEISKLGCINLNTIIDKYGIQTGLQAQGEQFPNTQVFELSPIATNLSEIIRYRRQNKWLWTTNQFNALASDLANAVKVLHSANISHNDIRPCNVFYSLKNNCYQLSSFGNAVRSQSGNISGPVSQFRSSTLYGAPELSTLKQANFQQADIYSLGMTLLCAFYLCQPIDRNAVTQYNKKFEKSYSVMSAIREMVMPIDKRTNIDTIIQRIPKGQNSKHMKDLISSLKFKSKPKDKRLISQKKMLSDGYQRLGLWNQWRNLNFQAYSLEEATLDEYKKANSLFQLAKIQSCRGQEQSANQYAKSASKIYRGIGHQAFNQGNINQSVNFYTRAAQCSKYFQNRYDTDTAKNYLGLALAHSERGEYQISKPLINQSRQIIARNLGRDSIDYCKVRISQAKIQTQYLQYDSAEKILQQCLMIADKKSNLNQQLYLKLKAQILHELGQCSLKKALSQNNAQQFEKSQKRITNSILINNQFPNNHLFLAQNVEKLGQIQLRKKNYQKAKNNFNKATEIRQQYASLNKDNKQEVAKIEVSHANNLCLIGDCEKQLGNCPQALRNFNLAIQKYRRIYGSDHNKLSAIAIGNMAKVYHRMNEKAKASDCLKVAMQILLQISGKQDPDYQYFNDLSQTL